MGSRIASHNQPKWSVELQPGCRRDRLPPRVAWIIWTERADRPELVDSSSYFISGPHCARKSGRSRAMLAEAVREELIERNVASIVRPHDPRSILIIAILVRRNGCQDCGRHPARNQDLDRVVILRPLAGARCCR